MTTHEPMQMFHNLQHKVTDMWPSHSQSKKPERPAEEHEQTPSSPGPFKAARAAAAHCAQKLGSSMHIKS